MNNLRKSYSPAWGLGLGVGVGGWVFVKIKDLLKANQYHHFPLHTTLNEWANLSTLPAV